MVGDEHSRVSSSIESAELAFDLYRVMTSGTRRCQPELSRLAQAWVKKAETRPADTQALGWVLVDAVGVTQNVTRCLQ